MKKIILIVLIITVVSPPIFAQEKQFNLEKSLSEIDNGTHKGPMLNNKDVEIFLKEFLQESENYGLLLLPIIQNINFIFVEPSSVVPAQLTGDNLGKVDISHKLILLSKNCLLDNNILKATLFRELSHYLGVPYDLEGAGIMSIKKPEGYSYDWLGCNDAVEIQEFEYYRLFAELKKHVN